MKLLKLLLIPFLIYGITHQVVADENDIETVWQRSGLVRIESTKFSWILNFINNHPPSILSNDNTKSINTYHSLILSDSQNVEILSTPKWRPQINPKDTINYSISYNLISRDSSLTKFENFQGQDINLSSFRGLDTTYQDESYYSSLKDFSNLTQIGDPSIYPWRMNVKIRAWHLGDGPNGENLYMNGSGVLIQPNVVLTCGHLVYDVENGLGLPDYIEVIPGYENGNRPYGTSYAIETVTFAQWSSNGNFDWDLGLISLNTNIGYTTGYFNVGYSTNDNYYLSNYFHSAGYPAASPYTGEYLYYSNGTMDEVNTHTLLFERDSYGGQSGSGYYQEIGNDRTVFAIHSFSRKDCPPTPSYLNTTNDQCDRVVLTWENVDHEDGYYVYRDNIKIASRANGENWYYDYPPNPGTYQYSVSPFNEIPDESGNLVECEGDRVYQYGTRIREPYQVTGVIATSGTYCNYVRIYWNSTAYASSYTILKDNDPIGTVNSSTLEFYDYNVNCGETYSYSVQASNSCGPGFESSTNSGHKKCPPDQVQNVYASDGEYCDSILITWDDVDYEDEYVIMRNAVEIDVVSSNTTYYFDSPPQCGESYSYAVRSSNSCGSFGATYTGGYSSCPPTQVQNVNASDNDRNQVRISWDDNTDETGYRVYRNDTLISGTLSSDITEFIDQTGNGCNNYEVSAINSCSEGTVSLPSQGCFYEGSNPIYVSNNGSDISGYGTYSEPYQTLKHAIDQAKENDTIYLFNGTYNENYHVIDKNLYIFGENKDSTIVSAAIRNAVFILNGAGEIKNLTIDGSNATVNIFIDSTDSDGWYIHNNIIKNTTESMIEVNDFSIIERNVFIVTEVTSFNRAGIEVKDTCHIFNNIFYNFFAGIQINNDYGISIIQNNIFLNNGCAFEEFFPNVKKENIEYNLFNNNEYEICGRERPAEQDINSTNLYGDPLFIDFDDMNFHLTDCSPCIDAGNPSFPLDDDGSIIDIGVYPFNDSVWICLDSDGDCFGDPNNPLNICPDDNCPSIYNPDQADVNDDGIGNICDNTPPGQNVSISLDHDIDLNFLIIGQTGWTDCDTASNGPSLPSSFNEVPSHLYTNIYTNAIYQHPAQVIEICMPYDSTLAQETVEKLKMLQFNGSHWFEVQSEIDTINHKVCGTTDTLGIFYISELSSCCADPTGDINNDGGTQADISDLLYLVDYMFTPGSPAPECAKEADVNGDGGLQPDISDLLYLVDYMFTPGAPAPADCQ